eukprot:768042-Hanusia_phi.AAC.6
MGSFSTANGDVYLGEFHRGKYHGRGMQEQQLGGFYKGWWQEGRKEGNGTMFYANGDIYEGGWLRDARHGWGKMCLHALPPHWPPQVLGWKALRRVNSPPPSLPNPTALPFDETSIAVNVTGAGTQRTGQVFEGRWQDGLRYGHGVIHYGQRQQLEGSRADEVAGNGDAFSGNFVDDERQGDGAATPCSSWQTVTVSSHRRHALR